MSRLKMKLDALPREVEPPPELQQRITADLMTRGLLGGSWVWRWAAVAVLCVCVFGAGYLAGLTTWGPSQPEYMLLLFEDERFKPDPNLDLVAEYTAWAVELSLKGNLVEGKELSYQRGRLGYAELPKEVISGFFRIRAADLEAAIALANTCPHLKYGGSVEVRALQ